MKAIIATNEGTIIEGKLFSVSSNFIYIDTPSLPAYKAKKLIDEGTEVTKYPLEWHLTIPRKVVHSFELLDEENQPQAE